MTTGVYETKELAIRSSADGAAAGMSADLNAADRRKPARGIPVESGESAKSPWVQSGFAQRTDERAIIAS